MMIDVCLQCLFKDLGFEISMKILVAPTISMNYLGNMVDTISFTLAIPHKKMCEIFDTCDSWRQKTHSQASTALLGSLLYVTKFVHLGSF